MTDRSPISPPRLAPLVQPFNVSALGSTPGCRRAALIADAYLAQCGYPPSCDGWVLFVQAQDVEGPIVVPPSGPFSLSLFGWLRHGADYELGLVSAAVLLTALRDAGEAEIHAAIQRATIGGMLTCLCSDGAGHSLVLAMTPNPSRAGRLVAGGNA